MKRLLLAGALVLAVLLPGATIASAHTSHSRVFTATLTGAEETPPVHSAASGTATFHLSADGTRLHFRVSAQSLDRITQAHIHVGPPGVAGPVVAFLFPDAVNGVDGDGFEVAGTITSTDLIGPFAGQTTLAHLVDALRNGNAYANVHTLSHPAGEIRGQIHTHD